MLCAAIVFGGVELLWTMTKTRTRCDLDAIKVLIKSSKPNENMQTCTIDRADSMNASTLRRLATFSLKWNDAGEPWSGRLLARSDCHTICSGARVVRLAHAIDNPRDRFCVGPVVFVCSFIDQCTRADTQRGWAAAGTRWRPLCVWLELLLLWCYLGCEWRLGGQLCRA